MIYTADFNELDLKILLDRELVEVHFQPIFSLREKKIVGFEALSRGIHPVSGKLVPPLSMLKAAREFGLVMELDRLFRKKILETFKACCPPPHDLFLSVNFETSILNKESGNLHLIHLCHQLNLDPSSIIIEILESRVKSLEDLRKFIHIHREHGFLIALDDMGKGHSNLDRISLIQPDLIKIDRSLVMNLQDDYIRQETFKSLVNLSRKIGALVLAEGVETEEETLKSLELGADLLQGYYFSHPEEPSTDFVGLITNILDPIADKFKNRIVEQMNIRKIQHERFSLMMENLVTDLSKVDETKLDQKLKEALAHYSFVKALYVLDDQGLQISEFICDVQSRQRKGIFRLGGKGTDYSTRDYFYALMDSGFNRDTYTSEAYISPATGLFCLTISAKIKDKHGKNLILCADVVPTYLKNMGRLMNIFGG
jgi:EAL domain-containing protein (putative c-di-GMP-specific phosphodiesterase class I)